MEENFIMFFIKFMISYIILYALVKLYQKTISNRVKRILENIAQNKEKILSKLSETIKLCNIVTIIYFCICCFFTSSKGQVDKKEGILFGVVKIFIDADKNAQNVIYKLTDIIVSLRNIFIAYIMFYILKEVFRYVYKNIMKLIQRNKYKKEENIDLLDKNLYEYFSKDSEMMPILITGEWGSGKTHAINNFFEKYYKYENRNVYKVSCFGITNKENFINNIKEACENNDNSISSRIVRIIAKTPVVGDLLKTIFERKYDFNSLKPNSIFIFDNFERISPYIRRESITRTTSYLNKIEEEYDVISKYNIVTGIIDELKENYKMKIVIIADETNMISNYVEETFISKLGCKKYTIEPKKDIVFEEIWKETLDSYVKAEKYKEKFNNIFLEVKDNAIELWKKSNNKNIRIFRKILYNYIHFITELLEEKYIFNKETNEEISIFYTNFIVNLFNIGNWNYYFANLNHGENISLFAEKNKKEDRRDFYSILKDIDAMWYSNTNRNKKWEALEKNSNELKEYIGNINKKKVNSYWSKFNYNKKEIDYDSSILFEDLLCLTSILHKDADENVIRNLCRIKVNYGEFTKDNEKFIKHFDDLIEKYNLNKIFSRNSFIFKCIFDKVFDDRGDKMKKFCEERKEKDKANYLHFYSLYSLYKMYYKFAEKESN